MKYNFFNLGELEKYCNKNGYKFHFDTDTKILSSPLQIRNYKLNNRFCVHPMEGSDADEKGAVTDLVTARYKKFAKGGSALIWFEAVSVVPEGRASANQLLINEENLDGFKKLIEAIKEVGLSANGFEPVVIMQLTHSGRFSKPDGKPRPLIAYHHTELDKRHNIAEDLKCVTDEYLDTLSEKFAKAAALAQKAGFDGVDVKCCHRYLLQEFLSAFDRPGKYGGSYENRIRLLFDCVDAVNSEIGHNKILATRLNGFDALPDGFACDKTDYMKPALNESVQLAKDLKAKGMDIFNITTGSPYYNSFVNRPNDVEKMKNRF